MNLSVSDDLLCFEKPGDYGVEASVGVNKSLSFVYNSPIQLQAKTLGQKRGRRSNAETLHTPPAGQLTLVDFIRGKKRPLVEEVDVPDKGGDQPPTKRALFVGDDTNSVSGVYDCVSDSETTLDSLDFSGSTQVRVAKLLSAAVTSSPVKMSGNDLSEVKGLFETLLGKFQTLEDEVKQKIDNQEKTSADGINVLKNLVSNLDAKLSDKISTLEKRLEHCESTIAAGKALGAEYRAATGSESGVPSPFSNDTDLARLSSSPDFIKIRKYILDQERERKKCNMIIRGSFDVTLPAQSVAANFLTTYFRCDDCIAGARWLRGGKGGLHVTIRDFEIKKRLFKVKRDVLKDSGYFMDHDLTDEDAHAAMRVREVNRRCKMLKTNAKQGFNAIWVNNTKYSFDPLLRTFLPPLPFVLRSQASDRRVAPQVQVSGAAGTGVQVGNSQPEPVSNPAERMETDAPRGGEPAGGGLLSQVAPTPGATPSYSASLVNGPTPVSDGEKNRR